MKSATNDEVDSPRVGWALVFPAAAFLATFTYYPAIATFWESLFFFFFSGRPARFVGMDNYAAMVADPIFWRALGNNAWFALGTIPSSIALAHSSQR